jgi:RNA binding exosome subunit
MNAKTLSQRVVQFEAEDEEIILKKLRNFQADHIWFDQHYSQLKKQYGDEWVAVLHKQVIDHGKNLKALRKRLQKNYSDEMGNIVIEFVLLEEIELIL